MIECEYCLRPFDNEAGLRVHWAKCSQKILTDMQRPVETFRLTPDDIFAKSSKPQILTQRRQRYLRKKEWRFHRQCLKTKAKAQAKRAIRHGWKPKNDFRSTGDIGT